MFLSNMELTDSTQNKKKTLLVHQVNQSERTFFQKKKYTVINKN
jgi:hypothetical protein